MKLSIDIWRLIIHYLRFADKKSMREVCKDFHQLVTNNQKLFKPILYIVDLQQDGVCNKFHQDYHILRMSSIKIRIAIPSPVVLRNSRTLATKLKDMIENCHERVEQIEVTHFDSKEIVKLSLSKLAQLKKAILAFNYNSKLIYELLRKNVGLEILELFGVSFVGCSLQPQDLPNLKEVVLGCCSGDALSFLSNTSAKVTKLKVSNTDIDDIARNGKSFPYLTDCELTAFTACAGDIGIDFLLSDTSTTLTKLKVYGINFNVQAVTSFPCLRECEITSFNSSAISFDLISRSPNLTKLTLTGEIRDVTARVDLSNVNDLTIIGYGAQGHNDTRQNVSQILDQTGHNLTKLHLHGAKLATVIKTELPNLKDLTIYHCGGQLSSLFTQAAQSINKLHISSTVGLDMTTKVEKPLSNLKFLEVGGNDRCLIGNPLLTKPGTLEDLLKKSRKRKLD